MDNNILLENVSVSSDDELKLFNSRQLRKANNGSLQRHRMGRGGICRRDREQALHVPDVVARVDDAENLVSMRAPRMSIMPMSVPYSSRRSGGGGSTASSGTGRRSGFPPNPQLDAVGRQHPRPLPATPWTAWPRGSQRATPWNVAVRSCRCAQGISERPTDDLASDHTGRPSSRFPVLGTARSCCRRTDGHC